MGCALSTGKTLPNPEEFPETGSEAAPVGKSFVGFHGFKLEMKDGRAVATDSNNRIHILKLVCSVVYVSNSYYSNERK